MVRAINGTGAPQVPHPCTNVSKRSDRTPHNPLVQLYINRAKAYNGVVDELVTKDGAPILPAPWVVRAGFPLKFPTQTVAISALWNSTEAKSEVLRGLSVRNGRDF